MCYLGVELNGIELFVNVLHCGAGTVFRPCDYFKALGRLCDIVGMAHPYNVDLRNIFKNQAVP